MPRVEFSLYLVTDRHQTGGRDLVPLLGQALAAGVGAIQVREKDLATPALLALAREVLSVARQAGRPVLINDRVDLVLAADADGVHLRSDSLPVRIVRGMLGSSKLIGVSTHSAAEVAAAEAEGADFAVLGPIYATASKRSYGPPIGLAPLQQATRRCRIPILAIGGVTAARVPEVRAAGASGVAVISAVLGNEAVLTATRALLRELSAPI
jgi:thiamine-phosphate pyrophosphorylase